MNSSPRAPNVIKKRDLVFILRNEFLEMYRALSWAMGVCVMCMICAYTVQSAWLNSNFSRREMLLWANFECEHEKSATRHRRISWRALFLPFYLAESTLFIYIYKYWWCGNSSHAPFTQNPEKNENSHAYAKHHANNFSLSETNICEIKVMYSLWPPYMAAEKYGRKVYP